MTSTRFLDQVQSLTQIAAAEAEPATYAARLAAEVGEPVTPDDVAAADARLADALARIDALAARVMRIRLEHALAADPSIAAPTQKVFASTIVNYVGRLDLLEDRAQDVARRGGSRDPSATATHVVVAAEATLALREALRHGALALIAERATATAAVADAAARDRRVEDGPRRAWSAVRRELEAVAARPERVTEAAFATRLASWPAQLDDPDPATEPTFADMIELD